MANGTGKSTIGRILAGLLKEKSGEVVLFGKHCRSKGRLGKVWYIPQDLDSQLFGENLLDELTTGAEVTPERKKEAEEILGVLELTPFIKQHPSTLSGGQKQRLALGVALMHKAPIIVLDEPTSGLDGTNMRNVSRMIRKLAKMGRTIIVITHDAECALACCERAIRLENGCITDDFQIRGAELLLDKIGYDKRRVRNGTAKQKAAGKRKPDWHAAWNWLPAIKGWCSWQVFWRRWLRSVLLYRTYQSTTSFGKSCLFTRICRS